MKQNTLYSAVVNFINSYKLGETYTSEDFKNALQEVTSGSRWAYNGQWYRVRTYQTYLKSAGFITNVKRGVWRINYNIPDWMSLYALETLRGYKDGYWNGRVYVKRPDTFRNELTARLRAYKQRIDKDGVEESRPVKPIGWKIGDKFYVGHLRQTCHYIIIEISSSNVVTIVSSDDMKRWGNWTVEEVNGLFKRGTWIHLSQEEKAPEQSKTMVCTSNRSYNRLTIGKEYKIIGEEDMYYNIIDDDGDEALMFKWRFAKIKTLQQDTKKTWKIGDTLSADLLNNYPHNFHGYDKSWETRSYSHFSEDRKIKKIDIVDGRLAALISGTMDIWIEIATIDGMDNSAVDKVPQDRLSEFLTELEALIAKYK